MTDEEFLDAFEAQAISREDWTHEAHVRMAWLYARREASREAMLDKVRNGIKRLNAVNAVEGKLYHETVTMAFGTIIHHRVTTNGAPQEWPAFRDASADLTSPGPSPLLKYYRQETLDSDAARLGFVLPDLKPLPD